MRVGLGAMVREGVDVIVGVADGFGVAVNVLDGGSVGNMRSVAVTNRVGVGLAGFGVNENVAPGDVFAVCAVVGGLNAPGELPVGVAVGGDSGVVVITPFAVND